MEKGDVIFAAIAAYIKDMKDPENKVSDAEINKVCKAHGKMFMLLDGGFSALNASRGSVMNELIQRMQTTLELARKKWVEMGLSVTLKCHVLFNHAIELLLLTGGFVKIGKDRIERSQLAQK
jgi:hypothetical protein